MFLDCHGLLCLVFSHFLHVHGSWYILLLFWATRRYLLHWALLLLLASVLGELLVLLAGVALLELLRAVECVERVRLVDDVALLQDLSLVHAPLLFGLLYAVVYFAKLLLQDLVLLSEGVSLLPIVRCLSHHFLQLVHPLLKLADRTLVTLRLELFLYFRLKDVSFVLQASSLTARQAVFLDLHLEFNELFSLFFIQIR